MPTIQKRSVIFSSSQPPSSKWWWSGAIRKSALAARELEVADLDDDRHRLDHEDDADERQDEDLAGDERDDRQGRARATGRPESPMKICAGWTLNHRKPSSAPMISAHSSARFGWAGTLSRAMIMYATKAKTSVPPASPSRPSVMLTPLAAATMANAANDDVDPRGRSATGADERDRDRGDVVRLLDLPGGDERHDRQPEQLLAGPDPLAGPGVEVVVEGAEQRRRPASVASGAKVDGVRAGRRKK